jgi:predicted dehydrogenase
MSLNQMPLKRRDFVRSTTAAASAFGLALLENERLQSANDRIQVAVIGAGNRGSALAQSFARIGENTGVCRVVAVADVYQRRLTALKQKLQCDAYLDYREIIRRNDIDAVAVATPDHWHAAMALEAMAAGKDVYLEKPMCHTIKEARQVVEAARAAGRIVQVGSQTTSADQWHKAKKAIADGMIGKMIMSQGSYHRNSVEGEWNYKIDPAAGPDGKGDDYLDWKMWLGSAPKKPWDPDRYFRFRKYWDYSGGIATDLFYHVAAPLNICWSEPQFPYKVMAAGAITTFSQRPENPDLPDREVPDTFHLIGEYSKGHSIVLSSSMANSQHIPGLIRGHEGSVIMVEHGMFESYSPYITVKPETRVISPEYKAKFGAEPIQIPVEKEDMLVIHMTNFLDSVRSRKQPVLNAEVGARPQVLISMAVQSYREGKILYFDEATWRVTDRPPRAMNLS